MDQNNHFLSNSANGDSNNVSPRTAAVGTSFSQNLPSSSARRMVPRNELELSRPAIARAEKDGDDPSSSSSRRRLPPRGHSSTPVTLTRLFAVQAPTSPTQSRAGSFYKRAPGLSPSTTNAEADPLALHLYVQGLVDGKYSDIKLNVLGKSYDLHRLVLDRSPFFASAFSPPWRESTQREVELHPEGLDPNITSSSFELALKRLYGCPDLAEEAREPLSTFATGCWLEMKELVAGSLEALLGQMRPRALGPIINVVTANYYGKGGSRVLTTCKSMLSRDGWLMPIKYWDDIPSEVIRDIVSGDNFFVHGEWRRWLFIERLFNRRLRAIADDLGILSTSPDVLLTAPPAIRATAPRHTSDNITADEDHAVWAALYEHSEILPLLELIDRGIYYMHLEFEQLQHVRSSCDVFGTPLVPAKICDDALWAMCEFRQAVAVARHHDEDLGLAQAASYARDADVSDVVSEYQSHFTQPPQHTANQAASGAMSPLSPTLPFPSASHDRRRRFWIPNVDCNIVTGGDEPVVTLSQDASENHTSPAKLKQTSNDTADQPPESYTRFPPFRFAAELPHPRSIKDNKRTYSRTVSYAGSLWNIYMQKKRIGNAKTPEVGIYLHRAKEQGSDDDGLRHSSVDERIGALEREMLLRSRSRPWRHGADLYDVDFSDLGEPDPPPTILPSINPGLHAAHSSSPLSTFMIGTKQHNSIPPPIFPSLDCSSDTDSDVDHATSDYLQYLAAPGVASTLPSYLDTRPIIKTYYRISCPAKGGRMLSVYESKPDRFKVSQSLGWKCNSLIMEEEDEELGSAVMEVNELDGTENPRYEWVAGRPPEMDKGKAKNGSKLRLTVVLGVI